MRTKNIIYYKEGSRSPNFEVRVISLLQQRVTEFSELKGPLGQSDLVPMFYRKLRPREI